MTTILLSPPPLDDEGVKPHDHPEILNEHRVIRRISEQQIATKLDTGERYISSMAYKASSGKDEGMSVDLEFLIQSNGIDTVKWVTTPIWVGSVIFKVSDLRALLLQVGYDPIENVPRVADNLFHGQVWGKFTKGTSNRLQALAEWFVSIPNVDLKK